MLGLFLTAIALASDAFAISVCKGLSAGRIHARHILLIGLYFGTFQALMPCIGYMLGERFRFAIESVDHFVASALLLVIGVSMIVSSFQKAKTLCASFAPREMLPLAISTSIDALAVGVTLSIEHADIRLSAILIGTVTAGLSMLGLLLGSVFGEKYKAAAERCGGVVLILMGVRILVSHLI